MSTIEIQFDKRIDNSRIRRDLESLWSVEYVLLTLLGGLFVVSALFYGWQQYQWIQYGYRIEEAQRTVEDLTEAGRRLRLERQTMASPERIDRVARSMGMVAPSTEQVLIWDAGAEGEPAYAESGEIQLARRATR